MADALRYQAKHQFTFIRKLCPIKNPDAHTPNRPLCTNNPLKSIKNHLKLNWQLVRWSRKPGRRFKRRKHASGTKCLKQPAEAKPLGHLSGKCSRANRVWKPSLVSPAPQIVQCTQGREVSVPDQLFCCATKFHPVG